MSDTDNSPDTTEQNTSPGAPAPGDGPAVGVEDASVAANGGT